MSITLSELTDRLIEFRNARDWQRFHALKNLIQSVSIEAGELLELVQWQDDSAADARLRDSAFRDRLAEECADVFLYLLLIAERAGFELDAAALRKIEVNERKYPVEKARGNARKYSEL